MFAIHHVAISTGKSIKSDKEARDFLSEFSKDNPQDALSSFKWYSSFGLVKRDEPYYTWSNGKKDNFIPLSDPLALQYINDAERMQDGHLARISDQIHGKEVLAVGEQGRIFGIPVVNDAIEASRITQENKKLSKAWNELSAETHVKSASSLARNDVNAFIMLDQIKTFHSLIVGDWVFESMFYCVATGSSSIERFRQLWEASESYTDNAYLFAIEFRI